MPINNKPKPGEILICTFPTDQRDLIDGEMATGDDSIGTKHRCEVGAEFTKKGEQTWGHTSR